MQTPGWASTAQQFCALYAAAAQQRRFVLGRNVYARSVISHLDLAGVVDDFTDEASFEGVPVLRSSDLPPDALVINASGGRPFTAKAQLDRLGLMNLDYFAFFRFSELPLQEVVFNEGFTADYEENRSEYDWISERLADQPSRTTFDKLTGFRRTLDLRYLDGFTTNEAAQYFEDFLKLNRSGESFVDVGCFNGSNSLEFARLAPEYRAIHAFEPDPSNFEICAQKLRGLRDVHLYNIGLSDRDERLMFSPGGSGSKISDVGTVEIVVDRLDNIIEDAPTLIKMDIEGAEYQALEGAQRLISRTHPRLAICVYHKVGDFHRIPRLVLEVRDDYDIFLRHYTETIYETVMFFVPSH